MQLKQVRYSLIIGAIAIAGIIIIQSQWIFTTWKMNKVKLDQQVWLTLKETAQQIAHYHDCAVNDKNPVQKISNSCYLVELSCESSQANLKHLLKTEFNEQDLPLNYFLSVYNCNSNKTEYLGSLHNNWNSDLNIETISPCLKEQYPDLVNYFILNISGQNIYLLKQIKLWIFLSIIVLVILIFFTYTILSFYNQKQLTELQKDFINNMTHEFKTPISSIAISSKVLMEYQNNLPERAIKYIGIIDSETKRLNKLVESVLQSAKMEKDRAVKHFTKLSINQIIEEIIKNNSFDTNHKKISINNSFKAIKDIALGDELQAKSVFFNLIENAIKYNPSDVEIQVNTYNKSNKYLYIEIIDNGLGIRQEDLKNVFKKFYRVSTGNVHDVKGFGLGLFYVKTVCKNHGWKINLKSELHKGSVFTIKIPYIND